MSLDHFDNDSLIKLESVVHGNMVTILARTMSGPINGMAGISFSILEGLLIEIQQERIERQLKPNKHCEDLLICIKTEREEMTNAL